MKAKKPKKETSIFSVVIRKETREKIDELASNDMRSRSNIIDLACLEYWKRRTNTLNKPV
jgi:predicted transcriptional regulator